MPAQPTHLQGHSTPRLTLLPITYWKVEILKIRDCCFSTVLLIPLNLGLKQPRRRVFINPIASSGKTQVMWERDGAQK